MENTSTNPYRTPGSNVGAIVSNTDGGINSFERFSAWGVLGLAIITMGIYTLYWLYSRAKTANTVHEKPISNSLVTAFAVFGVIYLGLSFAGGVASAMNTALPVWTGVFSLAYIISYFILLFTLRNRLKDIIGAPVSGVLTFFGSVFYLQYKINQKIDGAL